MSRRLERVPDRWLPAAYLIFAHLCLLTACLVLGFAPRSLSGFFYHPKLVAVVHLVTLGWITGSILGALHLILPMALRTPLPARRADRWAFWFFVVGVLGMVSHFWIGTQGGMVWSAGLVVASIARVGWRSLTALAAAPIAFEHRLPFFLAFGNMLLAALIGVLLGIDKDSDVLPGFVLDQVAGHAHLAALGWATFMVMGSAYRLLPMVLPSAVPTGRIVLLSSVVSEIGVLALSTALMTGSVLVVPAAMVFLFGLALFLSRVRWMLAHPRPPAKGLQRPDLGVAHIAAAFAYLVCAAFLGAAFLLLDAPTLRLRLLTAYGVVLLIGFLAQMVVGITVRLFPLFTWMRDFSGGGFSAIPPPPHQRASRPLHLVTFWAWTLGTPLLAAGMALDRPIPVSLAGTLLAVAIGASLWQLIHQLRPRPLSSVLQTDADGQQHR